MTWRDFDVETALERDMLQRSLPLVPLSSGADADAVIDMATGSAHLALRVSDTLGPTPSGCVAVLEIRPLLVSAAWKVIDLLLETAYELAGLAPAGRRWTIAEKQQLATAGVGEPATVHSDLWRALTGTYAATTEIRHSLVHRIAHLDGSNSLIGVREDGAPLRPFTAVEQEALSRAALRAAELVTGAPHASRVEADLARQLGHLNALHRIALPSVTLGDYIRGITLIAHPVGSAEQADGRPTGYEIDLRRVREVVPTAAYADLTVQFPDRPGADLRGVLEDAPADDLIIVDPDRPPDWLS